MGNIWLAVAKRPCVAPETYTSHRELLDHFDKGISMTTELAHRRLFDLWSSFFLLISP